MMKKTILSAFAATAFSLGAQAQDTQPLTDIEANNIEGCQAHANQWARKTEQTLTANNVEESVTGRFTCMVDGKENQVITKVSQGIHSIYVNYNPNEPG